MQEWRKQMNAALGQARALSEQGQTQAAVDAASRAASLAQTSAAATAAVNLRQQIYSSHPPISQTTQTTTTTPSGSVGSPSGSAPSGPVSYPQAPPPAPNYPVFRPITGQTRNVLVAPSDIIQFDNENVDIALMQDLLFEDIGAVELANISRSDLIDGQEVSYSPIKNLSTIRREFNPNNIILTANSNDFFSRFGIDLSSKTIYEPYFDEDGNLVIEIDGVAAGEEIDVQILSNGTIDLVDDV